MTILASLPALELETYLEQLNSYHSEQEVEQDGHGHNVADRLHRDEHALDHVLRTKTTGAHFYSHRYAI